MTPGISFNFEPRPFLEPSLPARSPAPILWPSRPFSTQTLHEHFPTLLQNTQLRCRPRPRERRGDAERDPLEATLLFGGTICRSVSGFGLTKGGFSFQFWIGMNGWQRKKCDMFQQLTTLTPGEKERVKSTCALTDMNSVVLMQQIWSL